MTQEEKKCFLRFLKEHNAYVAFWRNLKNDNATRRFDSNWLTKKSTYQAIISAFNWHQTPEGGWFWSNLHEQWCRGQHIFPF